MKRRKTHILTVLFAAVCGAIIGGLGVPLLQPAGPAAVATLVGRMRPIVCAPKPSLAGEQHEQTSNLAASLRVELACLGSWDRVCCDPCGVCVCEHSAGSCPKTYACASCCAE